MTSVSGSSRRVAVATTSELAATAARDVHAAGGNAVDCALAASLLTMNTEPGVCALAGGAYVTIWGPGIEAVTIDGNVAVPGAGLPAAARGQGAESVTMDYGGGIVTLVGAGSVGVPGSLAAVDLAWQRYGNAAWQDLLAPSIRATPTSRGGATSGRSPTAPIPSRPTSKAPTALSPSP